MPDFDFSTLIEAVARAILGEPNKDLSSKTEWRFGTHGSLSVAIAGDKRGTWFDHEANEGGGVLDLIRIRKRLVNGAAIAWLRSEIGADIPDDAPHARPRPSSESPSGIVAVYDYRDEAGELIYQVCRKQPKKFVQRRPDGNGGYVWTTKGIAPLPYRLPELLASDAEADPVFIAEGEKDVEALRALGLVATCNAGGAGKWKAPLCPHFQGRDVIILPDNDEAGENHALDVARKLQGVARRVRILRLPGLPDKGDPYDWINAGGTLDELVALAEAAPVQKVRPDDQPRRRATHLPLIRVSAGELHVMADEAERALLGSTVPIYQRGRTLVRPIAMEIMTSNGRKAIASGLVDLTVPTLMENLCKTSEWERYDSRAECFVRTNPPEMLCKVLLNRQGEWPFPHIAGVITTPTMRADGSLITAYGYDPATRLYHVADPDLRLHPAVQHPTRQTAVGALEALKELLTEFPFVETEADGSTKNVSLSVALSGLITPVVRGALPVAPMHVFRASTAGSGKSYLADVVSTIASGRECPVVSVGADNDQAETEKRLVGLLLGGFPIISLDNVNGELGGDLLCQAIERPVLRIRRLGVSDITEIESRATIFGTGNNLRVRGDMVRRVLVADLDAGLERPELREFKQNPVGVVLADRGRYVSACLIIVRAYLLAGCPNKMRPIASFEAWSDLVRSALVWLGCDDPAESMEVAREDDPELSSIREVMTAWHRVFGTAETTTSHVVQAVQAIRPSIDDEGNPMRHGPLVSPNPELETALTNVASGRNGINAQKLGFWLANQRGKIVSVDGLGPLRFEKAGTTDGAARWKLRK